MKRHFPGRGLDLDLGSRPCALQGPGNRRIPADPVVAGIDFIGPDKHQDAILAILGTAMHPGAEPDHTGVGRATGVDDDGFAQAVLQSRDAGVEIDQLALRGADIAHAMGPGGFGNGADDVGTFDTHKAMQLGFELTPTLRGNRIAGA